MGLEGGGGAGQGASQEAPVASRRSIQLQNGKTSCQQKDLVSLFRIRPPLVSWLKHFSCQEASRNYLAVE